MESNKLYNFYSELRKDSSFFTFYKCTTYNCRIHSPIKNVFSGYTSIDNYLFGIPKLFRKLELRLLLSTYKKYYQIKKCKYNYRERCVLIAVLLKGMITGCNYDNVEFNLQYGEISETIHGSHIANENLCKKMNIFDTFEKVLNKIAPCIKNICTCKRLWDNCIFSNQLSPIHIRLDMLERIVWETILNDFYYFVNLMHKMHLIDGTLLGLTFDRKPVGFSTHGTMKLYNYTKTKNTSGVWKNIIPMDLDKINEQMLHKILDYFQLTNSSEKYACIYNGTHISSYQLPCLSQKEILTIEYVEMPDYCFVCGKYDVTIRYDIINNKYFKTIKNNPVRDFACNNCKEQIIDWLKLESYDNPLNNPLDNDPIIDFFGEVPRRDLIKKVFPMLESFKKTLQTGNGPTIYPNYKSYFQQRRLKPLMLIVSNLFDMDSLFALFPRDIIVYIILFIYWHPFNAIPDESFYMRKSGKILYSKFRPFGKNI